MIDLFQSLGAGAPLARGLFLSFGAVVWTVLLVRLVGLRSFSKMTSFDFVTTIATGSLTAQADTQAEWPSYSGDGGNWGVYLIQWSLAVVRQKSDGVRRLLENEPVLLMEDGRFLERASDEEMHISRPNILEKLHASNVSSLEEVRDVVLETTGDISVLTGAKLECHFLKGSQKI